jgi:2'-phosphotransferase
MSYLLRHHAPDAGVDIRPDGYVRMVDLLQWKRMAKLRPSRDEIHHVVQANDKKRFHILMENGVEFVRAAQGHSITVGDVSLPPPRTFTNLE